MPKRKYSNYKAVRQMGNEVAKFMNEYYKTNPKNSQVDMINALYHHLNYTCSKNKLKGCVNKLLRDCHIIMYKYGHENRISDDTFDEILKSYPYFWDIREAIENCEVYKRLFIKSNLISDPRKVILRNKLTDKMLKPSSEAFNSEEHSTLQIDDQIQMTPSEIFTVQSDEPKESVANQIDESLLVGSCSVSFLPLKNETVCEKLASTKKLSLEELKLKFEHEIELQKLDDQKKERSFRIEMTKLNLEHEITKLKLAIDLERTRSGKT